MALDSEYIRRRTRGRAGRPPHGRVIIHTCTPGAGGPAPAPPPKQHAQTARAPSPESENGPGATRNARRPNAAQPDQNGPSPSAPFGAQCAAAVHVRHGCVRSSHPRGRRVHRRPAAVELRGDCGRRHQHRDRQRPGRCGAAALSRPTLDGAECGCARAASPRGHSVPDCRHVHPGRARRDRPQLGGGETRQALSRSPVDSSC